MSESDLNRNAVRSRSRLTIVFGVVVVLVAVVLAGIGISNLVGGGNEVEPPLPSGLAEDLNGDVKPDPAPTETLDPHNFDVGADATPEQIGESHRAVTETAISTLLNQADYDAFINDKTGMTSGEFSRSLAEQRLAMIFDAQWVDGWRDNIVLLKRYEYLVDQAVLRWNNYEGGDSVVNTLELASSQEVSRSADQIVLEIGMTEHYQGVPSDQNNGEYSSVERVTYKLIDGRWRVIDWLPISGDH